MPHNKPQRSVYLATSKRVHNGKTYVSHLLRHAYREGGKLKQLTLGSLTKLPNDVIELIRRRLNKGEPIGGHDGGGHDSRSCDAKARRTPPSCPSWLLSFHFTTKDTKSTKKSENEMPDAIRQLCHLEVHQ